MKHRIRRALMAAAVLASTLVTGVVIAPPAHATTYYTNTYTNLAQIAASTETNDSSLPSFPVGSYHAYQCAGATFNPTITDLCDTAQNQTPGATQTSGGSATLKLKVIYFETNGDFPTCNGSVDNPDKVRVEIHNSSGTQIGSTDWEYTIGSSGFGPCENTDQTSKTIYLDNDPLDNDNSDGALTPGSYAIYLKFLDTDGTDNANSSGVDSLGAHGNGPNDSESVIKGTFTVAPAYQYLLGWHQGSKSDVDASETTLGGGNQFGLVRDFKSTWANPGTTGDVANYAAEGKAVAWSAKPPAWSGSCPQNLGVPGIEACSGTSAWDLATAAATTGTVQMRTMIRQLQDLAGGAGEPSFHTITITHEPHDNAIDTAQGWNGGAAGRKCGAPTDPGLGVDLNADGDFKDANEFDPCSGTAQDFKDMYVALRATRDNSCTSGGATTGTGFACDRVKIQYIGVTSRLTTNSGGGVGSGDTMRPASGDFDILGADPYNYGCFDNSSCTGDGGWETFEDMVDSPASSNSLFDLAASLGKRVILDEVGSHPGCNGVGDTTNKCNNSATVTSRSTWMDGAYTYMTTDAEAKTYLIGWIYYHVIHTYEWRFLNYGAVNPDSRGRTSYTNNFAADANFLTTANSYVLDLTP